MARRAGRGGGRGASGRTAGGRAKGLAWRNHGARVRLAWMDGRTEVRLLSVVTLILILLSRRTSAANARLETREPPLHEKASARPCDGCQRIAPRVTQALEARDDQAKSRPSTEHKPARKAKGRLPAHSPKPIYQPANTPPRITMSDAAPSKTAPPPVVYSFPSTDEL